VFALTSYIPHGLVVLAVFGLFTGVLFLRQLRAAPQTHTSAIPVSADQVPQQPVKRSAEDVFVALAKAVGQAVPAQRLVDFKAKADPVSHPRYWAVVDFNQRSTDKRLYIFDTVENKVSTYYVSHGRGSEGAVDDGIADKFSNEDGSFASSLGIYRTLDEYTGKHGRSLRLEGLEPTNLNVLARGVVMHTADYVSEDFIRQTGRLGRSEGCFAVERSALDTLINELEKGAYVIAWKS